MTNEAEVPEEYQERELPASAPPEAFGKAAVPPEAPGTAKWECMTCGKVWDEDTGSCSDCGGLTRKVGKVGAPVYGSEYAKGGGRTAAD